jgi:hypothetical protein
MTSEACKSPPRFFFEGQFQHLLLLACLVAGAIYLAQGALDGSRWLGIPDSSWFLALIVLVIVHQVVVWLVWRSQLCFSLFTEVFGERDILVWALIFFPVLLLRPLLTLGLGIADSGSMGAFRSLQVAVGLLLLVPAAYTLWSVPKYFGLQRALGGDHFREEYRDLPPVREGAFKYSANAMYTLGFLGLWAIAFLTGSIAALAAALFQHAYVWVHWYCTEQPDISVIYGKGE